MPWRGSEAFTFGTVSVLESAPLMSGVYALFAGRQWVYIGQSENIRIRLLQHLNGPDPCIINRGVTAFAYELVPPGGRVARQKELILEFTPVCPGDWEFPEGGLTGRHNQRGSV